MSNTEQSNYFIIDSFFSVKSSITDLLTASPRPYTVQTYNKATIQPNSPQLSLQSRGIMKARRLRVSISDDDHYISSFQNTLLNLVIQIKGLKLKYVDCMI